MEIILIALLLLCDIVTYIIIFDVILSWLILLGIQFRPAFIRDLLDPLYEKIAAYIPVSFGPFLFTPIILLLCIYFIRGLIVIAAPGITQTYQSLLSFL